MAKALEHYEQFQQNKKLDHIRELSLEKKIQLIENISLLTHEQKKGIMNVVGEALPKFSNGQTVFSFDVNQLPTLYQKKLW